MRTIKALLVCGCTAALSAFGQQPSYNEVSADQTNFSFTPGTWYISRPVSFDGTLTFHGSAIIKLDQNGEIIINNGAGAVWSNTPEHPTVFTSINDDSVGTILPGSSGLPACTDVATFIQLSGETVLRNCIFSHGWLAVDGFMDSSPIDVWDSRFLDVDEAFSGYDLRLHNVLFDRSANTDPMISINGGRVVAEHVTADLSAGLVSGEEGTIICYTNCLLTYLPSAAWAFVDGAGIPTDPTQQFFTNVAGAHFYLSGDSPFRDIGTTNITPALLAELGQTTTYAPQNGGYPDAGLPDLGYHYPMNEDSDFDGLPDWWEWKYFGSFSRSSTDSDGNGSTLLADYLLGRNPYTSATADANGLTVLQVYTPLK